MRPLPELTPENTAFWTGGARGELMITFCETCSKAVHPPELVCPVCLRETMTARRVAGSGVIYTFTVNHQAWTPGMKVPFAIAVVDVDGAPGVRVTGEVVGCEPDAVHIGAKVQIGFTQAEDVWLPHWTLAP
ncbi:MAG: OB-fold domain-containing protein [Hyphomonadaceae bacterium]|nr:OB-fold domain-containing protein [Hyphomonadaceae bacterium]